MSDATHSIITQQSGASTPMTIIGNWKSNKNMEETRLFFDELARFLFENPQEGKDIIICPTFTSLKYATDFVHANDISVEIGAQNVSQYEEGAYTGEVAAAQLSGIASCAIVGHSERRRLYGETEEVVAQKVQMARKANLKVILCLQNEEEQVEDVEYIAYEPPSAIGSGDPDSPENIKKVLAKIKQKNKNAKLLYGGSVTEKNIQMFTEIPSLEGFLIGGASLAPDSFTSLISKC